MGANFATNWQRVAKLLQDGSSGGANADAAVRSVVGMLDKLEQLHTPPKAVWKRLVQQMKVCCDQGTLLGPQCTPSTTVFKVQGLHASSPRFAAHGRHAASGQIRSSYKIHGVVSIPGLSNCCQIIERAAASGVGSWSVLQHSCPEMGAAAGSMQACLLLV